ncbi:bifunctional adenosylcobinamide kinase/adenosylcobinamide-phosphate guanylyltransferase [Thalassococcus sp. CAU 1522]|uniref:Bifunctional adenosylcobalamin biosynthesis protein n=1 Tax=Thalassococcus arenae TaxID=2851652 RepID=A0ABS6NCH2_9RHOB|nr:bifunctional adenosylcobinamide kinase/adenosylcobinamide-phosphate guanylyltransferase [Thalassococcus arenae]MBV2361245.1 bifunctional adenosylcobinamide kinase/adenosylcobinamide-phosphate guanylyltransferase [Thalassococcus arenae]
MVLGGARSGKSGFAERLAGQGDRMLIATAQAGDDEMAARIARHRADRAAGWAVIEEPLALEDSIAAQAAPGRVVVADCLTLWLSNLMMADADVSSRANALCAAIQAARGPVILVSNEVGLSIVPDNPMARAFRDNAGRLNQAVATVAAQVYFIAAGLPLVLKTEAGQSA